jgi:hypothetical protein
VNPVAAVVIGGVAGGIVAWGVWRALRKRSEPAGSVQDEVKRLAQRLEDQAAEHAREIAELNAKHEGEITYIGNEADRLLS